MSEPKRVVLARLGPRAISGFTREKVPEYQFQENYMRVGRGSSPKKGIWGRLGTGWSPRCHVYHLLSFPFHSQLNSHLVFTGCFFPEWLQGEMGRAVAKVWTSYVSSEALCLSISAQNQRQKPLGTHCLPEDIYTEGLYSGKVMWGGVVSNQINENFKKIILGISLFIFKGTILLY